MNVLTDHPVAHDSADHLDPKGAKNDNTHHPRFVEKTEKIFHRNLENQFRLSHLDLGCAGGGLVKDFLDKGHKSIGIEGSDYPKVHQLGEWPNIPDNLFTADITKPFTVVDEHELPLKFSIVTAFEVLEHIHKKDLEQLIINIKRHINYYSIFVASVATFPDGEHHVTLEEKEWWLRIFKMHGFVEFPGKIYDFEDYPRKGSFHLVLTLMT